ncbi:MAG: HAMP domain-containing protein [Spirochaetes bacterium]|nr:HAMP domain-containing protein [Spirochaetota bacterium]MBN2772206.1 HAMP domain-containing protein [Spirochaetota bacterium]
MDSKKKKSLRIVLTTMLAVFLLNPLSNIGAVVIIYLVGPLVFTQADWIASEQLFELIKDKEWLNRVVPSVLIILYLTPILIAMYRKLIGKPAKRFSPGRILDVPLKISLIGISGWIVEEILFLSIWFKQPLIASSTLIVTSLEMLLAAIFSFVVSFFILEMVFRRYVIPRVFPDGNLSELAGNTNFSIRGRFFVYYITAALFPIYILSLFVLSRIGESDSYSGYITMIVVILVSGAVLTYLVSGYFREPLLLMKNAVLNIRQGDYNVNLPVTSNDELGLLSENLNDLGKELLEKELMKETFGKVVDPSVRDHLMSGNLKLGGEERIVTVLFTDIRNYTGLTEKMDPETVVMWLNRYFNSVSGPVTRYGGIVNKYIGDALMAVFGAPREDKDHASNAAMAALAMIEAREKMNEQFKVEGLPAINAGIGVHTGKVLAGNIGSASRMEYTVIGDTVNVAARVEKMTKELKLSLLITEMTIDQLDTNAGFKKAALCKLRGRSEQVKLYKPV